LGGRDPPGPLVVAPMVAASPTGPASTISCDLKFGSKYEMSGVNVQPAFEAFKCCLLLGAQAPVCVLLLMRCRSGALIEAKLCMNRELYVAVERKLRTSAALSVASCLSAP